MAQLGASLIAETDLSDEAPSVNDGPLSSSPSSPNAEPAAAARDSSTAPARVSPTLSLANPNATGGTVGEDFNSRPATRASRIDVLPGNETTIAPEESELPTHARNSAAEPACRPPTAATDVPAFSAPLTQEPSPLSRPGTAGSVAAHASMNDGTSLNGETDPWDVLRTLAPELDLAGIDRLPDLDVNVFDPAMHGERYKLIDQLVRDADALPEQYFLKDFSQAVREDVLLVGSVPVDELQSAEARVREQSVARVARERQVLQDYKKRLDEVVEKARARLAAMLTSRMSELRQQASRMRSEEHVQRTKIAAAFRAAEEQLVKALEQRKAEVHTLYGDLVMADGMYGGARGRRWRVEWDRTPQPIQVKLVSLRGVRDKAPAGRYTVVVSLQDRLGGRLLRWSSLKGQEWGAATLPVSHAGRYTNTDLRIDQSVFTACPARPDIRPSMVLVFEVYALLDEHSPLDHVIAWGAFPVSDPTFNVVSGLFKTPLLRGPVDPLIDRFEQIEKRVASDLNTWFCNMYFEVARLPRYVSGQREYEVALQFNSGLLGFPARRVDDGDEEATLALSPMKDDDRPLKGIASGKLRKRIATAVPRRMRAAEAQEALSPSAPAVNDLSLDPIIEHTDTDVPGVSYDLHTESAFDRYHTTAVRMIPRSRLGAPRALTDQERLESHTYSVLPPLAAREQTTARIKLQYVRRQLLSELGLSQVKSGEFWFSLFALVLMFWLRIYGHYLGQWLYLQSIRIPITDYTFLPVSVELNYQGSALLAREEIGVVCLGPLFLIGAMVLFCLLSALSRWLLHSFSSLASRFVCAWGILTIFDPVLILIVDLAMQRWEYRDDQAAIGDAFKLFWHFRLTDGSGLPGVFLTLFLYTVITALAVVVFYIYFLRLHMDGRLMDTYHRLNCADGDFLMPYDTEVSHEELKFIARKAEQWRGPKGERRKVAVYDYVWEEAQAERKVTTHVSIHTLNLDGSRDLHRQFLRLPDGAIVEVFGSVASQNIDGRIRINLQRANVDVTRLLSEATTSVNTHLHTHGDLSTGKRASGDYISTEMTVRRPSVFPRQSLHAVESHA